MKFRWVAGIRDPCSFSMSAEESAPSSTSICATGGWLEFVVDCRPNDCDDDCGKCSDYTYAPMELGRWEKPLLLYRMGNSQGNAFLHLKGLHQEHTN